MKVLKRKYARIVVGLSMAALLAFGFALAFRKNPMILCWRLHSSAGVTCAARTAARARPSSTGDPAGIRAAPSAASGFILTMNNNAVSGPAFL